MPDYDRANEEIGQISRCGGVLAGFTIGWHLPVGRWTPNSFTIKSRSCANILLWTFLGVGSHGAPQFTSQQKFNVCAFAPSRFSKSIVLLALRKRGHYAAADCTQGRVGRCQGDRCPNLDLLTSTEFRQAANKRFGSALVSMTDKGAVPDGVLRDEVAARAELMMAPRISDLNNVFNYRIMRRVYAELKRTWQPKL